MYFLIDKDTTDTVYTIWASVFGYTSIGITLQTTSRLTSFILNL